MPQAKVSSTESWLNCQIDKGMFKDEVAVTYQAEQQGERSVFVSRSSVKGNVGGTGKVRVVVVDAKGSGALAILPSANRDIISIRRTDLSEQ